MGVETGGRPHTHARFESRAESTPTTRRCSYCGDDLDPKVVVECEDCLYVYCEEHRDGALHLCAEICADCGPAQFGD